MSAISTILTRLRAAIWAIDVRDDIANAIEQCYSDVSNPTLKTEALEAALQTKIDAGEMAALTIEDHTITAAKLASGVIDNTLATSGAAADAKKTGDELTAIKADLGAQTEAIGFYDLDFVNYTHITGVITAEGSFRVNANKDLAAQFEVSGGKLTVTANSSKKSVVSFLKTSASLLSNGDSADFATGETAPREVTAGQTVEFELPSDCAFLLFTLKASNIGGYTPDSATVVTGGLAEKIEAIKVDETLTVRGRPADSAETGAQINGIKSDLYKTVTGDKFDWVQGTFNATNGNNASSSTLCRLTEVPDSLKTLTCTGAYKIAVFGWDSSNAYIGMWKNGTAFSTSVSSGTLDYSSVNLDDIRQYASKIKLRLRRNDSVAVTPSDAVNITATVIAYASNDIETNDNPCEYVGHDEICVFDKMLCIGDSLMEGGSKSPNVTDNPANAKRTVTRGMYSIPTFITKRFGVTTTNWGISGSTAKSWYNSKSVSEPDWGGYDSALIYIGSNDYTQITTGGMTVEESTAQSTTYLQNIISKLKTDNPGIRIFICTLNPGTTQGTLAQYRIPLMQAIRTIASNDSAVFCIDLNEYSSFQSGSAYSNGHPTAIGYQWMFREITNYINWWIAKHPADFKWIRYIGTSKAVTGNVTPEDDDDDGSYDGDVDTGNSGS